MVFQDPYASLNPMQMVGSIVAEPIMNFSNKSLKSLKGEVMELLRKVGLPEDAYYKYAHEFSGGQRQRIGPIGNGFPVEAVQEGGTALLVGGDIGVPPLHELGGCFSGYDFN